MIYLGPIKKLKGKKKENGKVVAFEYDGRILYTDAYNEMLNILFKAGRPVCFIKRHENYYSYKLSAGHAWQLIRLKDKGFVEFKELTLLEEQDYVVSRQAAESQRN